jgi:hypothetical protein
MNRKGQLGLPVYVILVVIVGGFLLNIFMPSINTVRENTLATMTSTQILEKLILYNLIPLIWIMWALLGGLGIMFSTRSA